MADGRMLRHDGHMFNPGLKIVPVLCLLAAGCGPGGAPSQPADATGATLAPQPSRQTGHVVGVRPLGSASAGESRQRAISQVLAVSTGGSASQQAGMEVVVRLDRGRDIAFTRPAGESWRIGQQVSVTTAERPELLPGT
ncbi:hypothetical protein [Roseococcus sp. YIM B11640]|uniref:hypothetical protein n=1 Tax=Roseococcus sp. YIM B11640 TaxID=3133973 RepID=UPI003C7B1C6F